MSAKTRMLRLYVGFSRELKKHLLGVGVIFLFLFVGILAHENFCWGFPTQKEAERKAAELIHLAARGEHGKLSLYTDEKSFEALTSWRPDTLQNIDLTTKINGDTAKIEADVVAPYLGALGHSFVFVFKYSGFGWRLISAEDKGYIWP